MEFLPTEFAQLSLASHDSASPSSDLAQLDGFEGLHDPLPVDATSMALAQIDASPIPGDLWLTQVDA